MDVQKVTHEVRLQQWSRIVKECRSSGKTIKAWCAKNIINIKTYYHWQSKFARQLAGNLRQVKRETLSL